jgi:hypothetical protein
LSTVIHTKELPMRRLLVVVAGLAVAGAAWAHNCPNEMKAIDAKLATNPQLSKENSDKVARLRADGEAHHKAGRHSESMAALGEAKKLLGI